MLPTAGKPPSLGWKVKDEVDVPKLNGFAAPLPVPAAQRLKPIDAMPLQSSAHLPAQDLQA